ncbi:TIGR03746 family integrating conjugative element protein [Endozoicomonas sp. SM1973]|uniref:TIGR03746 family integrating conjugative element protein n=1 Tax=Spartinivicinus marinus TaxID=2994442 RepID=A0A853I353_9GAMM|nr:TIGR03746 family integrating conjugative element protein [Spartinivicinus marinus]MCX4030180.1 TIGR03746 family integrating conjugative element protein [Spartinivicinus marinus]NYZ67823.1 TIGR03746 family integrating conjugative element protein [Spartinivicinus marinus]
MKYRDTLSGYQKLTTIQFVVIAFLMGACGVLYYSYTEAEKTQKLSVPPNIREGGVLQVGKNYKPNIYDFAYGLFQKLHHWPNDGAKDYSSNIYRFQGYFTPECRKKLKADMNRKSLRGELKGRERIITEIEGRGYQSARVQQVSSTTWKTWIDFEVTELVNGKRIKHIYVQYPLKVVKYKIDVAKNPWQLAIDCFHDAPRQLKKDERKQPFRRKS